MTQPIEQDIMFFAADQARHGRAPGTIRSRISAIVWYCESFGFDNPTTNQFGVTRPKLARVLRGITRMHTRARKTRLPITPAILKRILAVMRGACPSLSDYDVMAYKAAFTTALYGLLRVSEFAAPSTTTYEEGRTARAVDVVVHPDAGAEYFVYTVRASKADVFRVGASMRIFATGAADCPFKAMTGWLNTRRATDRAEPLFTLENGTYMTRDRVTTVLRSCLLSLGIDPSKFGTQSFRGGGCVAASAAGYDAAFIQLLGRWKSDSFLMYMTLSKDMMRDAQIALSRVEEGDVTRRDLETYRNRFDVA